MGATICGHMDPVPVPLKAISTADWDGAGMGRTPDFRMEVPEGLVVTVGVVQRYRIQFDDGTAIYIEGQMQPSPDCEFPDGKVFLHGYLFYRTPGTESEVVTPPCV